MRIKALAWMGWALVLLLGIAASTQSLSRVAVPAMGGLGQSLSSTYYQGQIRQLHSQIDVLTAALRALTAELAMMQEPE